MADISIVDILAALKVLEDALAGITTVFDALPATIAPAQLPALLLLKRRCVTTQMTVGVTQEDWTLTKWILTHTFPKALPGTEDTAEQLRRAYIDMVKSNPTISGTCTEAKVRESEVDLGTFMGVECIRVMLSIEITTYRRKT